VLAKLTIWSYPKAVKSRLYSLTHTDYAGVLFITVFAVMLRSSRFYPHRRLFGQHLYAFLLSALGCITYYFREASYLLNYRLCNREVPNFDFGRCRGCPTERLSCLYSVHLTTARILHWATFDIKSLLLAKM